MNCVRFTRLLLLASLILALSAVSLAGVFISVTVAPPPLPVYVQPLCPQAGYIWIPGYWAWGPDGYYWVPGTWALPPEIGLLWTPGYWGWDNGFYVWNAGYWGPDVGFYGGIDYGFGYPGVGFYGGEWRGGHFFYNTAVEHIDRDRIRDFYTNRTVVGRYRNASRVSYNGGTGGIRSTPTAAQLTAARGNHIQPTALQTRQEEAARRDPALLARNNHGKPAIAATAKAGNFSHANAIPAKAAGGRVNTATLRATPKSMPKAARNIAAPHPSARATRPASNLHGAQSAARRPSPAFTHPARPSASSRAARPSNTFQQRNFSSRAVRPSPGFRQPNFNNRPPAMASPTVPAQRFARPQAFRPSRSPAPRVQSRPAFGAPSRAPSRSFAHASPPQHFAAPAQRSAPAARPQAAPRENGGRR